VHIICYRTHIDWLGNAPATVSHAGAVSGALVFGKKWGAGAGERVVLPPRAAESKRQQIERQN